jgi:hypothetical protein
MDDNQLVTFLLFGITSLICSILADNMKSDDDRIGLLLSRSEIKILVKLVNYCSIVSIILYAVFLISD